MGGYRYGWMVALVLAVILVLTWTKMPEFNLLSMQASPKWLHTNIASAKTFINSHWDVHRLTDISKGTCINGQDNVNMPPVCEEGCLKTLEVSNARDMMTVPLTESLRKDVGKIYGWMDSLHVDVVNMLTKIQWSRGVYGTVGEIGVFAGKFASVFARHTDTANGERFFVCDMFELNKSGRPPGNMTLVTKQFFDKMAELGFVRSHTDEAKRLHVWYGSSAHFTKHAYMQMHIPSARLFSIDGLHYDTIVFYEQIQVACILRSGGIIVFDDSPSPHVTSGMTDFTNLISSEVFKPIIMLKNKLYVTTSDWHQSYLKDIQKNLRYYPRLNLTLKRMTTKYTDSDSFIGE